MNCVNTDAIEFISSTDVVGIAYKPLFHATDDWEDIGAGFTCITRFDPGICYPTIELLGPVEYLVLEGELTINGTKFCKGNYVRIEKENVTGKAGPSGCLVFCSYKKGLKFV